MQEKGGFKAGFCFEIVNLNEDFDVFCNGLKLVSHIFESLLQTVHFCKRNVLGTCINLVM